MTVETMRDELHDLIDVLPDSELVTARRYLEFLHSGAEDMLTWVLDNAPVDDEPTTPEEEAAIEEAWQEYLRDGGVSADEVKRLLLS